MCAYRDRAALHFAPAFASTDPPTPRLPRPSLPRAALPRTRVSKVGAKCGLYNSGMEISSYLGGAILVL
jgi:hypothetical protein